MEKPSIFTKGMCITKSSRKIVHFDERSLKDVLQGQKKKEMWLPEIHMSSGKLNNPITGLKLESLYIR